MKIFYYPDNRAFKVPQPESFAQGLLRSPAHATNGCFVDQESSGCVCSDARSKISSGHELHTGGGYKIGINVHHRHREFIICLLSLPFYAIGRAYNVNEVA